MHELGRVPSVGDAVTVDGWQVTVIDMDGRRVDRLRFAPSPSGTATDEGGEAR